MRARGKPGSTRVAITSGWSGNTRFAGGEITTSGGITDTTVSVVSTLGKRRASTSTNVLDDESLRRTVDLAERLAKLSPEDPEIMPELGNQSYATVDSFIESTADLGAEARAAAAIDRQPEQYAHYLLAEAGGLIELKDLKLSRLLNAPPTPYTRDRFNDNYQWTLGWGLVPPGATYENTVDNRAWQ